MMVAVRSCAVVGLVLLCHVSRAFSGSFFNASTLQALHVVDEKRYEVFLRPYFECTCYQRDGGKASDRIVANTEEPLPDMRRMLPRLANQTILFAGDSVVKFQFAAFAALLWESDGSCISASDLVHSRQWNFTLVFQWTGHILALQYNDLTGDLSSKGLKHELARRLAGAEKYPFGYRVPTVLFLSTAHHWTRAKYLKNVSPALAGKVDLNVLRAGVARANSLLKPFSHRTRIIWRAVSARHFASGDWDSGGSCSRTVPYSAEELSYLIKNHTSLSLRDSITYSAVIREEAELSGYEYVDILPYSVTRPDGVVGSLHPNKGVIDCSHYCVPGVPDVWNTVFLDHILS